MKAVSTIQPLTMFKSGTAVRIKNFQKIATVIEVNKETGRIVCFYFDDAGVIRDAFLPADCLVILDEESKQL